MNECSPRPAAIGAAATNEGSVAATVRLDPAEYPDGVLTAALVAAQGWPVLALWPGSKKPMHAGSGGPNHAGAWLTTSSAVLDAAGDAAELRGRSPNFAVLTGQPGGGGLALVCLDLDGDPDDLAALLAEAGEEAEAWAAATLKVQRCPERAHLWGLVPAEACPPTARLASGLEWRGRGGYVLLPGALHPEGSRYAITAARATCTDGEQPPGTIFAGITGPDADGARCVRWAHALPVPPGLLELVAARGAGARPSPPGPSMLATGDGDLRPSLARGRLDGALRWLAAATVGERNDRLNRTAGLVGGLLARVPEADRVGDLDADTWRRKVVAAGVVLGLDRREAERTVASGWSWGSGHSAEAAGDRAVSRGSEIAAEPVLAGTPWVDLSALATTGRLPEPPRPDHLRRADGAALLYRGRVNRLFGDYEAGKTWVLLAAAAEALGEGGRVAHLDLDHMGAVEVARRLALLGVPLAVLGDPDRFRLYAPDDSTALLSSVYDVVEWRPEFAGVDSLGEVLPMLALSSNAPDDFTRANRLVMQPLADAGCCVVVVDHLAKGMDSRRQGPTGTIAKGRPVRGVSLRVRVVRGFAPGRGGASALTVEKDTPGGVRALCPTAGRGGEQAAGTFRLSPNGDDPDAPGSLLWAVDLPVPGDAGAASLEVVDPDALERVSKALEAAGEPLSQNRIQTGAKVRRGDVAAMLDRLEEGGFIRRVLRGQSKLSEHVRPFLAADWVGGTDDE